MSTHSRKPRGALDAFFTVFGAVSVLLAIALTIVVVGTTVPWGTVVAATPAVAATAVFTLLLFVVGYGVYAMTSPRPTHGNASGDDRFDNGWIHRR